MGREGKGRVGRGDFCMVSSCGSSFVHNSFVPIQRFCISTACDPVQSVVNSYCCQKKILCVQWGRCPSGDTMNSHQSFPFFNSKWSCFSNTLIVEVPDGVASEEVQLLFRERGLGLWSPVKLAPEVCRAFQANCLSQVCARAQCLCVRLWEELEELPSRAQCAGSPGSHVVGLSGPYSRGRLFPRVAVSRSSSINCFLHVSSHHCSWTINFCGITHEGLGASRHFNWWPTCQETTEFRTLLLFPLHLAPALHGSVS